ncbi:MAG: phosphoadenylyl-sulfate reductase [Anaerolineales bacterium]|nr:phosphoadenylyl-sulfate reductase [Anaerolineales bacterium]
MAELDLAEVNQRLESAEPPQILEWAWQQFAPRIAATSSFQSQSLPLLHMITRVTPEMPVFFLDTGFHFQETLEFRDRLMAEWGLRVQNLSAEMGHVAFGRQYGQLHNTNPDLCCFINKVEPLRLAKAGLDAWITGIRRDQTDTRRDATIVSLERDGAYKICPMLNWTKQDVWRYINRHELPVHPLLSQGYMSIGCAPCTRPIVDGEDERSGRWAGTNKTECGLHLDSTPKKG